MAIIFLGGFPGGEEILWIALTKDHNSPFPGWWHLPTSKKKGMEPGGNAGFNSYLTNSVSMTNWAQNSKSQEMNYWKYLEKLLLLMKKLLLFLTHPSYTMGKWDSLWHIREIEKGIMMSLVGYIHSKAQTLHLVFHRRVIVLIFSLSERKRQS